VLVALANWYGLFGLIGTAAFLLAAAARVAEQRRRRRDEGADQPIALIADEDERPAPSPIPAELVVVPAQGEAIGGARVEPAEEEAAVFADCSANGAYHGPNVAAVRAPDLRINAGTTTASRAGRAASGHRGWSVAKWALLAVSLLSLALAGLGGWRTPPAHRDTSPNTKAIATIRVGERVLAENPTPDWDLQFGDDVDPPTWRKLQLRAAKADGSWAEVELLRPAWWLEQQASRVGGTIELNVPECGIEGRAEVLAIGPCPAIAPGRGQVVTGTFKHRSARLVDLYVAGQQSPIGTTPNHLFWSDGRAEFVRADELLVGEQLAGAYQKLRVTRVDVQARSAAVYNLEVHRAHVYHVSAAGILVHNPGHTPNLTDTGYWNYVLRDANNRIYYVGLANPGHSLQDVIRRHSVEAGSGSGTMGQRFVPGSDTIEVFINSNETRSLTGTTRIPEEWQRTYAAARRVEHENIIRHNTYIGKNGKLLPDGSANMRGNRVGGIKPEKAWRFYPGGDYPQPPWTNRRPPRNPPTACP
jgi:hypothetical protein